VRLSALQSRISFAISVVIIAAQFVFIAAARTTNARYFCWAPFDMQTDYALDVTVDGAKLKPEEISQRYGLPVTGTDNRSVQNLIDRVQLHEERYGTHHATEITLKYRINGKQEQVWRYPTKP
jgi:hypothetical protein